MTISTQTTQSLIFIALKSQNEPSPKGQNNLELFLFTKKISRKSHEKVLHPSILMLRDLIDHHQCRLGQEKWRNIECDLLSFLLRERGRDHRTMMTVLSFNAHSCVFIRFIPNTPSSLSTQFDQRGSYLYKVAPLKISPIMYFVM